MAEPSFTDLGCMGGGVKPGEVVGATNQFGEFVTDSAVSPLGLSHPPRCPDSHE
jgi:hypothetical protein